MLYAKIKDCFEVLAAVIFLAASGSVMAVEAISAIRDRRYRGRRLNPA
jgi:hypothetical protein